MVHTHTAVSPPPLRSPFDLPSTSLRTPSNLHPPSPQLNILVRRDNKLARGDTLAGAVERRHACIKSAVSSAGAKGHAATIVERHISLKLNTRQTQVKVPSSPGFVMLPGFQGVQSEREVKWEFGPADVSLGRREMLHGGMLNEVQGVVRAADRRAGRARHALGLRSIELLRPLSGAPGP